MDNALAQMHANEARHLIRAGQHLQAEMLLDHCLLSHAPHPEHIYLRGMLHARCGENVLALERFTQALHLAPRTPALLFNRGLILYRLERTMDALADFLHLRSIDPGNPDVWINLGILQLRAGRCEEALESLDRASKLRPASPLVMRLIANALREAGDASRAIAMHRRVLSATPDDPAALTDCALCLVTLSEYDQAQSHYLHALRIDPSDQTALAGLYMTGTQLGHVSQVESLMDYRNLLGQVDTVGDDALDLVALRDLLTSIQGLSSEPAGRSTRLGQQSPLLDLEQQPLLKQFREVVSRHIERGIDRLTQHQDLLEHPWLSTRPKRWKIQSWVTILEQGGRQTPHIHPAGWMSGVFYVDTGAPRDTDSGNLVFGKLPDDLPLTKPGLESQVSPESGQLITFPSYFFHNTTPHSGDNVRISLAFDVVPVS
jgi:uncharacterized protein (TIGR02466 family)